MKSRISFFNGALFRKNVTRFAPAWVLYTVFLVLVMLMMYDGNYRDDFAFDLGDSIGTLNCFGLFYALLVAQLLFGDLYSSRMCNALHALPMRRETWFGTHIITGLFFDLVPNLIFSLLSALLLGNHCIITGYVFLSMTLSYLFFFATAVFAALCVGSRFAMVVVYGILHLFVGLTSWIIDALYQPLLYGIQLDLDIFYRFWPAVKLSGLRFVDATLHTKTDILWEPFAESWWYLAICDVVGLALLGIGLGLYRRRHLEKAGDFVVVKPLAPVFLVLFTLSVGTFLQLLFSLFTGNENMVFLFLGLVIGFFTGLMLLKRTTRVFQIKAWLALGGLAAAMWLSLLLTWLDPIGITRYVPAVNDIASASISVSYNNESKYIGETAAELTDITAIHRHAIDRRPLKNEDTTLIQITYTLKSGRTLSRYYRVSPDDLEGQLLARYMSTPEAVLGQHFTDVESYCRQIDRIEIWAGDDEPLYTREDIQGFITAVAADCAAGTMAQDWSFHSGDNYTRADIIFDISTFNQDLRVWAECENTVAWLTQRGLLNINIDTETK